MFLNSERIWQAERCRDFGGYRITHALIDRAQSPGFVLAFVGASVLSQPQSLDSSHLYVIPSIRLNRLHDREQGKRPDWLVVEALCRA
jgi:hypothetical protein